ncbi:hypothetical protein CERSUDRAFT_110033 [Gelatoporia subvermispora B]|uniref:Xylosidase/arabinosidase n=1 Tax=Ceriporiopsis subvermispora (strain B) TaxID=914234 RepID=M2RSP6_CERS8|nr:hypothetical protein CERSUDRAFT_110033 [Gelatoporia subvermispora B]
MALSTNATNGRTLKRADPSTIQNKFMVGYQGWFTCHGDGEPVGPGHHGWLHWFTYPIPDGGRPNIDLWPDVSEYSPSELFPAPGLKNKAGDQEFLFSSRHPKTVERHFHWMALHGVDGAFLQRFAGQCDLPGNEGIWKQRDEVGDRVREAAEKEGRVFAIMYDVSGVAPDRIQKIIEFDWPHLVREKGVLDSPNYLHENGKPVVALWGFGFADSRHDPNTVRAITKFIRDNTPGGAYIMAGTPAHWRTAESDADRNAEFLNVWLEEFDAISPWTIGRYGSPDGADDFANDKIKKDLELINKRNQLREQNQRIRKVDYIPVIFPGGSGFNLSEGRWGFNDIPRRGGNFLWRQLYNVRRLGVNIVYGAMWDEYDEGTAFMPVVPHKSQLPVHERYNFMALDEDGFDLPSDWYMRICGFVGESLRGERTVTETFPSKELQDYWSSRPRYEDKPKQEEDSKGEKNFGSYEEWKKAFEKENMDEPPPPPYSLEADERSAQQNAVAGPSGNSHFSQSGPPVRSNQETWCPDTAVSSLATDLSRQSLHDGRGPPSPVAANRPPTVPENRPRPPAVPSNRPLINTERPPSRSDAASRPPLQPPTSPSTYGPSYGYTPQPGPPSSSPAPGPWSAPWPPPEWDVRPSPPQAPYSSYPGSSGPPGVPPPLKPRPSTSVSQSPTQPPHALPGLAFPSHPQSYSGYGGYGGYDEPNVGGFSFPQAHVLGPPDEPYVPYVPHDSRPRFDQQSQGPFFPQPESGPSAGSSPYGSPYGGSPVRGNSPTIPPRPFGGRQSSPPRPVSQSPGPHRFSPPLGPPQSGPQRENSPGGQYAPPPGPPLSNRYGQYAPPPGPPPSGSPGQQYAAPPGPPPNHPSIQQYQAGRPPPSPRSQNTGPVGSALNAVGSAAGQLAHAGSKFWNKQKR